MTDTLIQQKNNKQVAIWLLIGVGMIMIQVLLGGITRLTESGLSITEWKPITGALPPLSQSDWQIEFEKYRHTDQFKYVHQYFSLKEFKFIFFWEWFHRFWARLLGVVFICGFLFFVLKKKIDSKMHLPLAILFLLGALQGAIGWIMVKSGLMPEKYFVGHIELTTHFVAALILLSYTLWFALTLIPSFQKKVYNSKLNKQLFVLLILFLLQIIFGGFMAGLKAASSAPTWPSINGSFAPSEINELSPWIQNVFQNKLMIHFIHRSIGYTLFVLSILFFIQSKKEQTVDNFNKFRVAFIILISLQIILGISTLLNATNTSVFIVLGVLHQFTAMMLVICLVGLAFIVKRSASAVRV